LLALGAAVGGGAAIAAVLLHILGHGLAKTGLFLGAGRVLQTTGTTRIADVRALAARQPLLAGCLGLGVLALVGLPPFSLFASELGIIRAGLAGPFAVAGATAVGLVLLLVVAAALVGHTSRMLLGAATDGPGTATAPLVLPRGTAVAMVASLVAAAALGIAAGPLTGLIAAAAHTLSGAP
jgi:hydrogenase-4 component F